MNHVCSLQVDVIARQRKRTISVLSFQTYVPCSGISDCIGAMVMESVVAIVVVRAPVFLFAFVILLKERFST